MEVRQQWEHNLPKASAQVSDRGMCWASLFPTQTSEYSIKISTTALRRTALSSLTARKACLRLKTSIHDSKTWSSLCIWEIQCTMTGEQSGCCATRLSLLRWSHQFIICTPSFLGLCCCRRELPTTFHPADFYLVWTRSSCRENQTRLIFQVQIHVLAGKGCNQIELFLNWLQQWVLLRTTVDMQGAFEMLCLRAWRGGRQPRFTWG